MADIKNHSTLATSLVSFWDMEEASGTRYDLVGVNDLTDNNTVTTLAGKVGGAGDFESTNSEYLSITDAAQVGLDIVGDLSISAWVKFESLPSANAMAIVTKMTGATTGRAYNFTYDNGWHSGANRLLLQTYESSALATSGYFSWTPTTGTWYHVVVTHASAGNGTQTFYVDGVAQTTTYAVQDGGPIQNSAQPFRIGADDDGGIGRYFDGLIDEVGIWSKVLTQSEITDLYGLGNGLAYFDPASISGNALLTTSLTSYYAMEEASGNRADSHGTNTLTDNNTVASGTGILGTGADFEFANSEYLSITDAAQTGFDNLTNASFSYWVKLESDTDPVILGKFATGSQSYWIQIQTTNIVKFQDSTETDTCQIALTDLALATWFHMVFTYAAGVVKLYVNGVFIGTDTTTNVTLPNTTGYFSMGRIEKYNSNYLDGFLDEVGIWSKALTVGEVRALYGYGVPPTYSAASSIIPAMASLGVGA